ncbi:orotate phosphoribosyltransferase, partial [Pseudoalteromonas shioyasakiensis]
VWLVKKEEMPLVAEHGRKSLNFQLTMMIAYIVCFMLMFVVVGVILLPLVALFSLIMVVVSAIKANDGKEVKYPMAIEFIK